MRQTIDGWAFAARHDVQSGVVEPGDVGRLFPRLAEGARDVSVQWSVAGVETARGKPALRITASGQATLECQRCLGPVVHPFALEAELELASDLAQVEGAEDEIDRIVAGPAMDVLHMVEDELLLEMPMVPRHEQCVAIAEADRAAPALAGALARWSAGKARKEH